MSRYQQKYCITLTKQLCGVYFNKLSNNLWPLQEILNCKKIVKVYFGFQEIQSILLGVS